MGGSRRIDKKEKKKKKRRQMKAVIRRKARVGLAPKGKERACADLEIT